MSLREWVGTSVSLCIAAQVALPVHAGADTAGDTGHGSVTGQVTVRAKEGVSEKESGTGYDSVRLRRARRVNYASPGQIVVYAEALSGDSVQVGEHNTVTIMRLRRTRSGLRLEPPTVVLSVGGILELINEDDRPHVVYSKSGAGTVQQYLEPAGREGSSHRVRCDSIGHAGVFLLDADGVRGTLFVAGRHHVVLEGPGAFTLSGLPAGDYRITAWRPRLPPARREVTVKPGETTRIDLDLSVNSLPKIP